MTSASAQSFGDTYVSEEDEIFNEEDFDEFSFTPLEDYFNKNTKSFLCLAQQEISRSSIFRDPLFFFPELEDPNIDEALWGVDESPFYDDIGCERYKDLCKEQGIIPFRRVLNSLPEHRLDLKFYGLRPKEMRTICETLRYNSYVKSVCFQENNFIPESVKYIAQMFEINKAIESLDMKLCQIGRLGACYLNDALHFTKTLSELDISFNNIGDEGMENMAFGLRFNASVKKLNLSHNNLGERALIALGPIVEDNYMLQDLDLSWNYFYTPIGMRAFMEGLVDNMSIKSLNLSWNGIGDRETVKAILWYFKQESARCEHINLSNNRLTGISARMIKTGLMNNEGCISVNLGYNPMTAAEVEFFSRVLLHSKVASPTLTSLDFGNTWLNKSFLTIESQIEEKGLKVSYGGIYSNYVIQGPDEKKLLLERAKVVALQPKKKKQKKDIGLFILGLNDEVQMKRDEFIALLKKQKIKLDQDLIDGITAKWSDQKKFINVIDMKDKYMSMYPDTKLPEKKEKKKKGKGKKKKKKKKE